MEDYEYVATRLALQTLSYEDLHNMSDVQVRNLAKIYKRLENHERQKEVKE